MIPKLSPSIPEKPAETTDAASSAKAPSTRAVLGPGEAILLVIIVCAAVPVSLYNSELFLALNGLHGRHADYIWLGVTTLGDGLVLGTLLGALLFVNPRITLMGIALMLLSSVFVHSLKHLFPIARPAAWEVGVHTIGPVLRSGSFPSGHTAAAVAACVAVVYYCPRTAVRAAAVVMAILVGMSRIFVGAHYPLDVLGGALCSLAALHTFQCFTAREFERAIPETLAPGSMLGRRLYVAHCVAAAFTGTLFARQFAESGLTAFLAALIAACACGVLRRNAARG